MRMGGSGCSRRPANCFKAAFATEELLLASLPPVQGIEGSNMSILVHLSDSLSNPTEAVERLVAALEAPGGLKNVQVSGNIQDVIVAQTGAVDPATVRLQVKENRKLSPGEVVELVDAYKAEVSQAALTRRFGVHEQTVRAHLRRQGVKLRPLRLLTGVQEAEAVRLYVEEMWSLAELADRFKVGQAAVRNVLVRRGVERRAAARRARPGSPRAARSRPVGNLKYGVS